MLNIGCGESENFVSPDVSRVLDGFNIKCYYLRIALLKLTIALCYIPSKFTAWMDIEWELWAILLFVL